MKTTAVQHMSDGNGVNDTLKAVKCSQNLTSDRLLIILTEKRKQVINMKETAIGQNDQQLLDRELTQV